MPTPAYIPLATYTLSSSDSSIEFTNIPQDYTDLICIIAGKGDTTVKYFASFNGDTSDANFPQISFTGGGSGTLDRWIGFFLGITNVQMNIHEIFNYSNSNTYKTYWARDVRPQNSYNRFAGTWTDTAPITTLRYYGGSFAAGTQFSLYGVL